VAIDLHNSTLYLWDSTEMNPIVIAFHFKMCRVQIRWYLKDYLQGVKRLRV
jgi:hypothetical protein